MRRVCGDHPLLRAAAILLDRGEVVLPHDIAPLVRLAYDTALVGPESWRPAMTAAREAEAVSAHRRRRAAGEYLLGEAGGDGDLTGWLRAGVGDADYGSPLGLAQVRDGEENLEVLVVRRDADGGLLAPDWVKGGGVQLPLGEPVPYRPARAVRRAAACGCRWR